MRAGCLVAAMLAGCSFNVSRVNGGGPGAGATTPSPSPTQSVPDAPDAATSPSSSSDMATQRIGTACTSDAQCDPGLFCATTFGFGKGRVYITGGYCTLDCASGAACPASSFCGSFPFGNYCISSCPPDACRGGFTCCDNNGQKGCAPNALCSGGGGGGGGGGE